MDNLDLELIKKKAKAGVIALTSRTAVLQLIAYTATFALTILLDPNIFGIFIIVSAAVSFLRYFSDIGLAAALIQKKEKLTEDDLKTTFTIQLSLVFLFVLLAFLLAKKVVDFYHLDQAGLWLFRSLLLAFFLSSLKTIPSVILERNLNFNLLVIPEIVESLFFYLTVIYLAWRGLGITSFTIGVLVRAFSGVITIYFIAPWVPKLGLNKSSAKKLLSFGIPFQLNSFLALIKDDLLILYLGAAVGLSGVAFIGWAKKWSEVSLRLIMDNINKVSFPAFARLQHNKQELSRVSEKAIFFVVLLTLPTVLAGMILIDLLVKVIPKYGKWEPALFSFYLFSIGVIFASISSLLTNIIQALGKVKIVLKLMILWTILTWILIPLFIKIFGFNGVSIAMLLISFTSIITIVIAKKLISFNFFNAFRLPLVIGILTAGVMFLARLWIPLPGVYQIIIVSILGFLTFIIASYLLAKNSLTSIWQKNTNTKI